MLGLFLPTVFLAVHGALGHSLPCQLGWTLFDGACYGYVNEAMTWPDAASTCVAHGGKLVEIETSAENNFVKNIAWSKGNTVWIGGNDLFKEGTMTWASGSTSHIIFSDYSNGQPDNYGGLQDCLSVMKKYNYQWNDYSCTVKFSFICEARQL